MNFLTFVRLIMALQTMQNDTSEYAISIVSGNDTVYFCIKTYSMCGKSYAHYIGLPL